MCKISSYRKHVATLPCEMQTSENRTTVQQLQSNHSTLKFHTCDNVVINVITAFAHNFLLQPQTSLQTHVSRVNCIVNDTLAVWF